MEKVQIYMKVREKLKEQISIMSEGENRTFANMAEQLLIEAVKARKK